MERELEATRGADGALFIDSRLWNLAFETQLNPIKPLECGVWVLGLESSLEDGTYNGKKVMIRNESHESASLHNHNIVL